MPAFFLDTSALDKRLVQRITTCFPKRTQVWPSLAGALALFAGVALSPLTGGLIFGDFQPTACSVAMQGEPAPPSEASTQENKPLPEKSAKHKPIVQPKESIPAPDQVGDCIFMPTPAKAVQAMLKLAELKPGEVLFDLGSGDGRICIAAAKNYGAHAYGYEIHAKRVTESLENVKKNKVEDSVTIERRDIFKLDLSGADVVTLWLLPYLNCKLIPQLEKMKPGSRIVSFEFDMCDIVKPDKVIELEVPPGSRWEKYWSRNPKRQIYLWKTPLKKDERLFRSRFPELAGDRE